MEIYERITVYFLNLPVLNLWEDAQTLFRRAVSGRPKHWLLPMQACEAVGGTADQSVPAATALACAHIAILLVDDMLDSDPRGEYQRIGAPAAANLACAFQSAALEAIVRCDIPSDARLAALAGMNEMFLSTALGQLWDVQSPTDEESYWRVVRTKSSPFFGAALQIGALAGGASVTIANRVKELGELYGEMIQIHDDLNDCMTLPANPDWLQGRSPLPILFAKIVDHPERAHFLELCQAIGDASALEEAQEILIRCGAVSYCVDQLLRRNQTVRAMLNAVPLARRETLDALFERVIAPVWNLFKATGESPLDASTWKELALPG